MPASNLPWRFELRPDALERTNEAHGNTSSDGTPGRNHSLLLGSPNRMTATNIAKRRTLPSNEALATIVARFAEAEGIDWPDAIPRLLQLVPNIRPIEVELEPVA
jgi:hypothetical protein